MRYLWGLVLLVLAGAAGAAGAKEYASTMQFEVFHPCMGTASFCAPMILAQGELDPLAPGRLKALLQAMGGSPRIVFDSPGGNLVAGIELGELIRAWRLDTAMGIEYIEEVAGQSHVVASDVICYSACAYAFMGGVSRLLVDGSRFGVHQFYGPADNEIATSQVTVAVISQYMKRMGVSRDLLDAASLTSSEEMMEISRQDAISMNLDNMNPLAAAWDLRAMESGEMMVHVRQQRAGSDAITQLAIAKVPDRPGVVYVVVQGAGFVARLSPTMVGNYLPPADEHGQLCSGEKQCVELLPLDEWGYDAGNSRLSMTYVANADELVNVVVAGGPLSYRAAFPEVASDLDPSVDLGRDGLNSALLALLKQSSAAPTQTPPIASVLDVKLGSQIDAQYRVPVPKSRFEKDDTIYLAVSTTTTSGARVPGTLAVHWTYGTGAHAVSVNEEVHEVFFQGDGQTEFHVSKPDGWPSGVYSAELFLDGNSIRKLTYFVN